MPELVLGGDISVWQDSNSTPQRPDLIKAFAEGWRFVFIKSSQANWADEDYKLNWKSARDAGLIRGAYHFMVWEVSPVAQAEAMWKIIGDDPGELPPTIDFEWWKETPATALSTLKAFADRIEQLSGRTPILYTGPYFWKQFGSTDAYWKRFWLWIANYGVNAPMVPQPWDHYTFWQYTSKGDGLKYGMESKNVDLDYFNGSINDLRQMCGLSTEPTDAEKLILLWQDYLKRNGTAS